jgi:hypothetical protein
MPRGGKRSGAGRKAGSRTKKTQQFLAEVRASGETPVDYMLRVMRDEAAETSRRDDMAKAAAPYVNSKMPVALVPSAASSPVTAPDDETVLNLYLSGLHAEADED